MLDFSVFSVMKLPVLKVAISTALPTVSTTTSAMVGASVVVAFSGTLLLKY